MTANDVFYCKGTRFEATAKYKQHGMVVLKGSKARKDMAPSFVAMSSAKKRQQLIDQGRLKREGDHYVFKEDVAFASPSGASDVVMATSSNGWLVWKTRNGTTLHEAKRSKAPPA